MKTTFLAAALGLLLAAPEIAKADVVRYYSSDEPVVRTRRVYTERRYVEPVYRDEVRVYRHSRYDDDYYDRDYRDRPRRILPSGPHRILQHLFFGD